MLRNCFFFLLSLFSFFFLFLVIECECVSIGVHEVDALTLFIYFPVLKLSIIPDSIHALRVLGCALMHASKKKKKNRVYRGSRLRKSKSNWGKKGRVESVMRCRIVQEYLIKEMCAEVWKAEKRQ